MKIKVLIKSVKVKFKEINKTSQVNFINSKWKMRNMKRK